MLCVVELSLGMWEEGEVCVGMECYILWVGVEVRRVVSVIGVVFCMLCVVLIMMI